LDCLRGWGGWEAPSSADFVGTFSLGGQGNRIWLEVLGRTGL
jgi:hypothetical protein